MNILDSRRNNPFIRPTGDARPIHNLPFEVLLRMFEFGAAASDRPVKEARTASMYKRLEVEAGGQERVKKVDASRSLPFQVNVSCVCRHWQNVATSSASIWTNVAINCDIMRPPFTLVSLHLQRSKQLPISITVNNCSAGLETTFSDAMFLYALLLPHVHRWRSIEVQAQSSHMSAFLDAVSDPSIASAPQLTTLRLCNFFEDDSYPRRSEFLALFNGSAPRLTNLFLLAVHIEWSQPWVSSASNLTTLEFICHYQDVRPTWKEFSTILRGAPALKKLTLCNSAPAESPLEWFIPPRGTNTITGPYLPIQLLYLTELVLGSLSEVVALGLLRKLYMPILSTLFLDLRDVDYSHFVAQFISPATSIPHLSEQDRPRSLASRLERLTIINLPCEDQDWISRLFNSLENVRFLRLSLEGLKETKLDHEVSRSHPMPFMLSLLLPEASPGDIPCMIPRLQSLFVTPSRSNLGHLQDVVQQRLDAGFPLKSLYVSLDECHAMDMEDAVWFWERLHSIGCIDDSDCWTSADAFNPDLEWVG